MGFGSPERGVEVTNSTQSGGGKKDAPPETDDWKSGPAGAKGKEK